MYFDYIFALLMTIGIVWYWNRRNRRIKEHNRRANVVTNFSFKNLRDR